MKNQRIVVLLLFVFFVNQLQGQVVNEKSARTCALRFIQMKNSACSITENELTLVSTSKVDVTNPELYIFNIPGGGFVIISGEQTSEPVIGYSSNTFIPSNGWNSNFDFWIQNSIEQINYLRLTKAVATEEIINNWSFLSGASEVNYYTSSKAISPLLRSIWAQDGAYNDMCPEDAQGEALVGCVATAMSQIMYYYRYPTTGNGSHSYYANGYGTQSVNFGATTYKWHEMLGDLTFPAPEVAKIGYHCGVAVEMSYGYDGSGAFSWDVDNAIESYFRYSTDASYKTKSSYTTTNWKSLLKTNIDALHPVYYSGSGNDGGHAFIIDGYEGTDYFHFDWGWGGYANGYFYIGSLNPASSSFNDDNQAIVNFYPPTSSYPSGCSGSTTLTSTYGTIEDGSGPVDNYDASSNCSWLINPEAACDYYKINFEEMDIASDDAVTIYEGPDAASTVVGTYTGSTLPSEITVNSSDVFITFISNSANQSKGFLLRYVGHVPLSCSGIQTLTNATDTFDDGSGSNHYGNGSFCRWNINPPGATSITLHFLDFELGDDIDYVRIIDAITGNVANEFTKGDNPTSVTINTTKMTVMFQSNTSITADGFNVYYTITTGMNEQPEGLSMNVYPNPASDLLYVVPGQETGDSKFVLYDFSGRMIISTETNQETLIIPVSDLSSGIYQAALYSKNGQVWQKIIVE